MTPSPVTTTRFLVAEREVDVRDEAWGVWLVRRVKAAMPVVVQRRRFRGAESLIVCLVGLGRRILDVALLEQCWQWFSLW